jgi:UDP-3-O-[3-hydroxymyristoyl] glucosamine N-acyltransferase
MGAHSGGIGHVRVGSGAQIAGMAHVKDDVDPGARMGSTPARPFKEMGARGGGNQTAWKAVARTRCTIVL